MAWTRRPDGSYAVRIGSHEYTVKRGQVFAWVAYQDGEAIGQAHRLDEAKDIAKRAATTDAAK